MTLNNCCFRIFTWMLKVDIKGEEIGLLPECALWWHAQKTLIIADVHWGKSAHFRKNGIAIPSDTQPKDEMRLAGIIKKYAAKRLIIAGDLFHSQHNNEVDTIAYWRKAHPSLRVDLVAGNHDILPDSMYEQWEIALHKEAYFLGPFCITHDMIDDADHFVIHGHIHPAIRISGKGLQSIKLKCFAIAKNRMILPAFGQFTGSHQLQADDYQNLYVVAENKVLQWK